MTSLSPRDDESRASTTIYDDVRTVVAPTDPLHGTTAAQATTEPDTEIPVGCMNTLRTYWPAIKVGIFYVIIGMPDNLTTPVLVKAKADFYGSDKQAALAQSCFDCSVALINFFVACFYGQLMNSFGRRKFFLAAGVMQLASFATLTALPTVPLVYQIVHAVYKLIQTSFIHAYVTDILAPSLRPKAFAIIQACGSAQLLSSILTGFLKVPDRVFYAIAAVMAGIALLWAFFMLPESLPIERRLPIDCSRVKNPFKDIAVLFKSHVLKLCVAILVLVQISDAGVDDVYMYYLQSRADFNKQDFSIMLFELAILSPLVALVLLPFALNRLSSSLVMAVAIAGNAGAWVVVGTVWAKWPIFAIVIPLGAIVSMAPPIVMALTANAGDASGIATRLTALAAVADLASAFGPLFFGLSYSQLPGALEALPFFIGAGFCAIAAYLSTWISGALHKDVIREVAEEVGVPAEDVSRLDDALIAERTEARLRDTLAPCGAVNTVPLWEGRAQEDGEYRPPSDRAPSSTRSSSAA